MSKIDDAYLRMTQILGDLGITTLKEEELATLQKINETKKCELTSNDMQVLNLCVLGVAPKELRRIGWYTTIDYMTKHREEDFKKLWGIYHKTNDSFIPWRRNIREVQFKCIVEYFKGIDEEKKQNWE